MGFDLNMKVPPNDDEDEGYWRDGSGGLALLVEVMAIAGVIDSDSEPGDVSHLWPTDMDQHDADSLYYALVDEEQDMGALEDAIGFKPTPEQLSAMKAYVEAYDREVASRRSPVPGLVPSYKFDSNANWHVVPEECALIADALDNLLDDLPENLAESVGWDGVEDTLIEHIEDWRDYNRVAATHGGYRVS